MRAEDTQVLVGLSGGVDSAVAAALLCQAGYQVRAAFMLNWDSNDPLCTAREDYQDACAVAERLGIECEAVNFADTYWDKVFTHFLEEYQRGRTPNPDILCNREVKFRAFLDHARASGADYVATGHYARVQWVDGQAQLWRGVDAGKDQSYFLHAIDPEALSQTLFPLGDRQKPDIRALARTLGLHVFQKPDSTGICFVGERNLREFLSQYLPAQPGPIVDDQGTQIGRHHGVMYYTLGQRKGLGIGGVRGRADAPWFVVDKNVADNVLVVSQDVRHPGINIRRLQASALHWLGPMPSEGERDCQAKVRYRDRDHACRIQWQGAQLQVFFDEAVRAATPGQSVVLYEGPHCLGGAVIDTVDS